MMSAIDSEEEECEEGNPVLFDGLRCLWHRCVLPATQTLLILNQGALPLSTLYAAKQY